MEMTTPVISTAGQGSGEEPSMQFVMEERYGSSDIEGLPAPNDPRSAASTPGMTLQPADPQEPDPEMSLHCRPVQQHARSSFGMRCASLCCPASSWRPAWCCREYAGLCAERKTEESLPQSHLLAFRWILR